MPEQADMALGPALESGFRLDQVTVEPTTGLVAGPAGREKLDPKVMDVLVMLAQHAGHVVMREEMLTRLWPDSVVTDESLSRCIYELRRQLSLAGGDERYKAMLETVPKRGYRLNSPVQPLVPAAGESPARRSRWLLVVAAAAAAIVVATIAWFGQGMVSARENSVAVLPFDDLSIGQDQGHFSDGVSEEIIDRLNKSRDLRVIARKSSFSFRDQTLSIQQIAAQLGVTHVLEGSVRTSGSQLRITARLVEAGSNSQLWSRTYEREIGDLFAVQDEIAGEVASALNATLAGSAERAPVLAAHNLFLQGQFFYERRGPGDVERSVGYYKQALKVDPAYAKAWAALAGAYSLLAYEGGMPRSEALEAQGEAARKAVDLDPHLATGHARLAQYYWDTGDRANSYRIFERAIALDPNDLLVLNFEAGLAMRNGEVDAAIRGYDQMVAREPRSASYRFNRGIYLQAADRFAEAEAELLRAKELNTEFGWELDLAIARILIVQKRLDEARALIEGLPEGEPLDNGLALLYAAEGRTAEADEVLAHLAAESTSAVDVRLAEVYAFRGMTEEAFNTLQGLLEAIERDEPANASQIWSWQVELRVSPFLKSLHGDPRWDALLYEPGTVRS
jgi:TolB-like protein/DNA-binding winged helix-turn-helix (wHTH) protein/Tfp pilus assembly protein PilF